MYRIVTDSSSNINRDNVFIAPLTVGTDERSFIDDTTFDPEEMVPYLKSYKGRSGSACPSSDKWLSCFGDAPIVFCVTMTSRLSGTYNSARIAKEEYESTYPDRKVHVFDSLSTAGEMELIVEKIEELMEAGLDFDNVCAQVEEYADKNAHLLFCLKSITNLVNNGRVSAAAAKISSMLNLRLIGRATDGQLDLLGKVRGEKNALPEIVKYMTEMGYTGGKAIISHCRAQSTADALKEIILARFPRASVRINACGALCAFYAEDGGFLIGFES